MINFNQLRVFYQTAKYQSCTVAAEKLYITQPAVTAQVKLLEDYCNLKLFKKKGRRIYLTDEGKTLYGYVRDIFKYEKEIESVIEEMRELKRGVLRLGTSKAYARYFMPTLLTHFREAHPHIKIHLDEGSAQDMIQSLLDLENEVAFIAKVEDHPNLCFIPFSHEELVLNDHVTISSGLAAVALATSTGGIAVLVAGAAFGAIAAMVGDFGGGLLNSHCDSHIDPPAFSIAICTTLVLLLL